MKNVFIIFALTIFVLQSCTYNNEEELYPSTEECVTTDMSFSTNIKPVLTSACLLCHSNANSSTIGGGIAIEDYTDVKFYADNGSLLGVMKHTSGYSPMPKGGSKIDDCKLNQIEAWINEGAKYN